MRSLYSRLKREGVDAWLDKEKLLPGADWEYEIRKAVREADVVVVCLSKQFNQAGFRQKEVRLALDTAMEKPEGEIFIIPARLEECDNLESLRKWHWVDLFESDGYQSLASTLKAQAEKVGVTLQMKRSRKSKPIVQLQKKQGISEKAISSSGVGIGDGVSESVIVTGHGNVINFGNSVSFPPSEKPEQGSVKTNLHIQWVPTDELYDGKPYISIDITNRENRLVRCRCYIKSLGLNGITRDDIKHEIVKHTNRVSWSGGSDEEVGIKHIDPRGFGRINLASLDSQDFIRRPLQFETAKGAQFKDKDGRYLPFGRYMVELGLACSADGRDFTEIPIKIGFEYIEERVPFEDDRIKNGITINRVLRLLEIKPK